MMKASLRSKLYFGSLYGQPVSLFRGEPRVSTPIIARKSWTYYVLLASY